MKLNLLTVALVALLGTALASAPISLQAATTTNAPTAPAVKKTAYSGTLSAIDAKSFTVTNKTDTLVLLLAPTTKFEKDKKPAKVTDFTVGIHVTGSYIADPSGTKTAYSLHTKTVPATTAAPAPKQ